MTLFTSFGLRSWLPFVVVGLVALVGTNAIAGERNWTNDTGSNSGFGWTNGASGDGDIATVGLWGDPAVNDVGFRFQTMNPLFTASASYPNSASRLSNMSVVLNTFGATPPSALPITKLHISQWGSFTGDIADVSASGGTVLLVPLSPPGTPTNLGALAMTFNSIDGTWIAEMDIELADIGGGFPAGVNILSIDVTSHLKAIPLAGNATMTEEGALVTIPEPAALTLGLLGLVPIVLRRTRRRTGEG